MEARLLSPIETSSLHFIPTTIARITRVDAPNLGRLRSFASGLDAPGSGNNYFFYHNISVETRSFVTSVPLSRCLYRRDVRRECHGDGIKDCGQADSSP